MSVVRDGLRAFGRFWWEFLVGDTPELFVATLVIVGVAFGLRSHRAVAVVVLPVLAIAMLTASAYRGRKRAPARRSLLARRRRRARLTRRRTGPPASPRPGVPHPGVPHPGVPHPGVPHPGVPPAPSSAAGTITP